MKFRFATVLAIGTAMLAAGCGSSDEAAEIEKGQVVATVNGTDVTIYELNAELQGVKLPSDPKQRKQVEQAALQQLVNRKILAAIAVEEKLDKSPSYLLQQRRANEALLVQFLQQNIASQLSRPTSDDARRYMSQHPELFAQRKIYGIEQIQFPVPANAEALKAFAPLKSLDEVAQKLTADGVRFQRGRAVIDTIGTPPELLKQVNALPPGEVFIFPNQGIMTANVLLETRIAPLEGQEAITYANNRIMQERMAQTAKVKLDTKIEKLRSEVKYQAGFAPPAKPAAKPSGT